MEEWKEYRLGELCSISSSKRIFAEEYKSFGIPFYRGKEIIEKQKGTNISTELYISESRYEEIKNKFGVPQKGDMLLTSVGTLGIPYIIKDETFYFKDGNLTWFYNFNGINSKFLYYWFLSPTGKNTIEVNAIGSTQKALTIDTLSKIRINIPNFKIQNKIVAILSSLDEKIELNRRINRILEQQAQALFKAWFVDFEPFKSGKFVDSELGKIPAGWKVGRLDEIGEIVGGGTPSKSKAEYYCDKGIPWVTPKDLSITHAKFTSKGEVDISDLGYKNSSTQILPKGSVLFSSRAPIGYITIALNDICTNQGFKSVIPKIAGTAFIYCYLKNNIKNIESQATGSTFKEASGSLMKSLKVLRPDDISIYRRFEEVETSLFEKQAALEEENLRLSTLRDTLLPQLMSGELKINDLNR